MADNHVDLPSQPASYDARRDAYIQAALIGIMASRGWGGWMLEDAPQIADRVMREADK